MDRGHTHNVSAGSVTARAAGASRGESRSRSVSPRENGVRPNAASGLGARPHTASGVRSGSVTARAGSVERTEGRSGGVSARARGGGNTTDDFSGVASSVLPRSGRRIVAPPQAQLEAEAWARAQAQVCLLLRY